MYQRARQVLAGGVSSDARRIGGVPLYVDHASGSHLWDVDGNRYVDYVLGQGPMLLGHSPEVVATAVSNQVHRGIVYSAQHESEVLAAEMLCALVPGAERVRFNSVGSEATHAAIRLARGHTGRTKIVKFEGHYHGWLDPVLYSVHPALEAAGPSDHPVAVPGTIGQQLCTSADLVVVPWNDADALKQALTEHGADVAAVIMEPIMCNSGAIEPLPGYLAAVQELCRGNGSLLIFDEIITGFRVAAGGAQEYLGITPDLATFGKALAGGMPVSALAGRADVMDDISTGRVAHAGTFNSHPVAMAGALAALRYLDEHRETLYPELFRLGRRLMQGIRDAAERAGIPMLVAGPGPVFQTYFTEQTSVHNYREFAAANHEMASRVHAALLDRGVSMVPRGLWFLSVAHTDEDVDQTIEAVTEAFASL